MALHDRARRERAMLFVTPVLLLSSPVIDVLGTLRLSLFTNPALLLMAGVAGAGALLGGLVAALRPREEDGAVRHALFAIGLGVVALAALDLSLGGYKVASTLLPASAEWTGPIRVVSRMSVLAGVTLAFGAVSWALRRSIVPVLAVSSSVLFASTVALNASVFTPGWGAPAPAGASGAVADLPPVLYIVMDEAMGVAGIESSPQGADVAARLRALADRGFRLYERSFSRHWSSERSIPNTLNFDFTDAGHGWVLTHHDAGGKVRSRLFDDLARRGYDIVSYGTAHIDFCFTRASRCETLPSFDPFSAYLDVHRTNARSLSRRRDVKAVATYRFVRHAFSASYAMFRYCSLLASFHDPLPGSFVAFDAYAFPAWFDRFARDVAAAPRGRAYFAHLLAPHAPYVLDAACAETGASVRRYFDPAEEALTGEAAADHRRAVYGAYYEQYRCALGRLETLLSRLDRLPAFTDATIVVQGDHGSRISTRLDAAALSDRDMLENSSTLYAIRGPGIAAGLDERLTSVQRLTAEYFSGSTEDELGPDNLTVVIDSDQEGGVAIRTMPAALAPVVP